MGNSSSAIAALFDELNQLRKRRTDAGVISIMKKLDHVLPADAQFTIKNETAYRDIAYYINFFPNTEDVMLILSLIRKILLSKLIFTVCIFTVTQLSII